MKQIVWLDERDPAMEFPPVEQALTEPDGLLAAGGDLSVARLLQAYRSGIFPWYSEGQPILWWSPDPRAVLFPTEFKVSRSLGKTLRNGGFEVRLDTVFANVIDACGDRGPQSEGTWLVPEMREAYCALHRHGVAHSVETWHDGELVGGLYGVALGRIFFGESMFTRERDASKVALAHLCDTLIRRDFVLIDCQMVTAHLMSLGARTLPRGDFISLLRQHARPPDPPGPWRIE